MIGGEEARRTRLALRVAVVAGGAFDLRLARVEVDVQEGVRLRLSAARFRGQGVSLQGTAGSAGTTIARAGARLFPSPPRLGTGRGLGGRDLRQPLPLLLLLPPLLRLLLRALLSRLCAGTGTAWRQRAASLASPRALSFAAGEGPRTMIARREDFFRVRDSASIALRRARSRDCQSRAGRGGE